MKKIFVGRIKATRIARIGRIRVPRSGSETKTRDKGEK